MYMQLFAVLADVGLYTTVVRDISSDPERTEELVGNALALRLALSIVVIAVAPGQPGAPLRPRRPRRDRARRRPAAVRDARQLARGGLPGAAADGPGGDRRRRRPGRGARARVVVASLDLGFYAVMAAAARRRARHAVADHLVFTPPAAPVRPLRRPARLAAAAARRASRSALALAINELYFRADTLIISLYEPYERSALYTLAYRILELTLSLGSVFLTTVLPVISDAVAARRAARAARRSATRPTSWWSSAPRWPPAGSCWRPQIVELAGGADFAGAAEPLRILLRRRRAHPGSTASSASR